MKLVLYFEEVNESRDECVQNDFIDFLIDSTLPYDVELHAIFIKKAKYEGFKNQLLKKYIEITGSYPPQGEV